MSTAVYRKMEREVQRFGEDLPVDALLPELEAGAMDPAAGPAGLRRRAEPAGPASVEVPADPAPVAEPEQSAEWQPGVPLSDRDDEARAHRPKRQVATRRRRSLIQDTGDDLESEIRDFMNRDKQSSPEEDDISELLDHGIDPNVD